LQGRKQNPHCRRGAKRSEKRHFSQIRRSRGHRGAGCALQGGRGKKFQQILASFVLIYFLKFKNLSIPGISMDKNANQNFLLSSPSEEKN
jgi:hypothetical protein